MTLVIFPLAVVNLFVGIALWSQTVIVPPVSNGERNDDRRHLVVERLRRRCHPPALGYDL